MKWKTLSKITAEQRFGELEGHQFQIIPGDPSDLELRECLCRLIVPYQKSRSEIEYDLDVGFALRQVLLEKGMTLRHASDDGIWRHLSVMVIPQLVYSRWESNPQRFYRERRRIWLRVMWWFVHLAWQGSEEATRAVVAGMTTDDVVQLVERPGLGFRVELCREIVKQASGQSGSRKLRGVMKINTASLVTTEPGFFAGGTEAYVKTLYSALTSAPSR